MGILSLIIAKATEINLACSTQDSVAPLQCHDQSATWVDLSITGAICAAVVISIWIVAWYIYKIVKPNSEGQKKNQPSDNESTQDLKKNDTITEKERFDAAWKFVDMCWKVEHPAPSKNDKEPSWKEKTEKDDKSAEKPKLTKADEKRYEEAWSVVRKYICAKETKDEKDK